MFYSKNFYSIVYFLIIFLLVFPVTYKNKEINIVSIFHLLYKIIHMSFYTTYLWRISLRTEISYF